MEAVRAIVPFLAADLPAGCTQCAPSVALTGGAYSFFYDPRKNRIGVNPTVFERQLKACRDRQLCVRDRRSRAYHWERQRIIYGNVAHELGHWLLAQTRTRTSRILRTWCEREGCRIQGPRPHGNQWEELYADYVAGYVISRLADGETPLMEFFKANMVGMGRGGAYPTPGQRIAAIRRGAEVRGLRASGGAASRNARP